MALDAEGLTLPTAVETAAGPAPVSAGTGLRSWWRRFARNRGAVFGLAVLVVVVLMSVLAPVLAPYDPLIQGVGAPLQTPSLSHWAGTDSFGRDVLSRIIYGARIALIVGVVSVVLAMLAGVTLGLVAGYYGGWLDVVIMRLMDGLFAFPIIILAIAMMAIMGFGVTNVIIAVGVGFIAPFARVTRADVLAPIIVQAALRVSAAIITEAGLSFLGLGPPPPTPVWGSMIAEGRNFIVMAPHISTIPGVALMVTIVALNLPGDGLRDTLDPRLRR